MITPDKIEEWINEAEERPASAPVILRLIANRLCELAERNEELLEENIALTTSARVEEYESRIAYLEYQLELLKRQFGGDLPADDALTIGGELAPVVGQSMLNLLVYDSEGHVLRQEFDPAKLEHGAVVGRLAGELVLAGEPVRLLVVPSTEEVLFLFTSGRVAARPVVDIPLSQPSIDQHARRDISSAAIPVEPRAGESLACLAPISKVALAEYLVQSSRKGFLKKIGAGMTGSILAKNYVGTGIKAAPDQTFELSLCAEDDRLDLVTHQGYLLGVPVKDLSFAIDEVMRLASSDHLVAAFIHPPGRSLLVMTQLGKTIQRAWDDLEAAASLRLKGLPLYSRRRREQGVRVVGAAAVNEEDWGIVLDLTGQLSIHAVSDLFASGALQVQSELLAFVAFSPAEKY